MQKYQDLNPFLQSVHSPINDKGFIPVAQNFPVANDSLVPIEIKDRPTENFFDPPSPIFSSFNMPPGGIPFINISQGAAAEIANMSNTYISYGITSGTAGTTNITSGSQTLTIANFNISGTTYSALFAITFKGKYTGFGAEGSAGTVKFDDSPSSAGATDEIMFAGNWAGTTINDFETITALSFTTGPVTGTTTLSMTFFKPSGGAGTITVKDFKVFAYYSLLQTSADT